MQQWHIETDIFALVISVILYLSLKDRFDKRKNRDFRFLLCVWINFVNLIVDIGSSVVYDYPVSVGLFHFTQTVYHALNMLTIIAWFHYVVAVTFEDKPEVIKRTDRISFIFYIAYVLFVISNIFTGCLYTYSGDHEYSRGPLFFLPVAIFALYAAFTLGFTLSRGRRINDGRLFYALVSVPVLLAVGVVLQLSMTGWLMIFPFYTAGLLIAFLMIQQNLNDIVFKDLEKATMYDALTGICSRDFAEKAMTEFLSDTKEHICALIIIDLDNFKTINDNYGHDVGDQVLRLIGKYLSGFFRESDVVARYGGDEFLIFLPDIGDEEHLRSRMSHLIMNLSELRPDGEPNLLVSCSAGVTLGVSGETDPTAMLRKADAALYSVKRSGKNDFAFYASDMTVSEYKHTRVDSLTLKHANWFDSSELKSLLYALSEYLPYIASVDLTDNTYYAMENSPELSDSLPVYGNYDSLLDMADAVFHPDDYSAVKKQYSAEKLLEAYKSKKNNIISEVRHKSHSGEWRWAQIACLFGPNGKGWKPRAYIIVRPHDEAHNTEMELYSLHKVAELAMQTAFEYICLLDTADGSCTLFGNDGKNSHALPKHGDFNEVTRSVRDNLVPAEERESFYKKAVLESVISEMKAGDGYYSYTYRAIDETREASFYYYEPTQQYILMTVQKKSAANASGYQRTELKKNSVIA